MTDIKPNHERLLQAHQPHFEISFWGIYVSGRGVTGIAAAVVVVGLFIALYRF